MAGGVAAAADEHETSEVSVSVDIVATEAWFFHGLDVIDSAERGQIASIKATEPKDTPARQEVLDRVMRVAEVKRVKHRQAYWRELEAFKVANMQRWSLRW